MSIKSYKTRKILFSLIFAIFCIVLIQGLSETFKKETPGWSSKDIRVFDPLDTSDPNNDLIAVYSRDLNGFLEFRLDFLDIRSNENYDYELLSIDRENQSIIWKANFSSASVPKITSTTDFFYDYIPTIVINPVMDYVVMKINSQLIHQRNITPEFIIQVYDPETGNIVDSSEVFNEHQHQQKSAFLLLEFWNPLPANTPSQLVRSWDGAHSGPFGQRHGLKHLITNAQSFEIPLILFDMKTSSSLVGISLLSRTKQLRELEELGTLSLPLSAYFDHEELVTKLGIFEDFSISHGFRLNNSINGFYSWNNPFRSRLFYSQLTDPNHIYQVENNRYVPIPLSFPDSSFSLLSNIDIMQFVFPETIKRKLVEIALSPDPFDLIALGDDLRSSPWADAQTSPLLFQYIAAHPWLKVLNEAELWKIPARKIVEDDLPLICSGYLVCPERKIETEKSTLAEFIHFLSKNEVRNYDFTRRDNPLSLLSLNIENKMNDPAQPGVNSFDLTPNSSSLRFLRLSEIWFEYPFSINSCAADLDLDGYIECVIASENVFLIVKPEFGTIPLAIGKKHQEVYGFIFPPALIAPQDWNFSTSFTDWNINSGLSDSSSLGFPYSFTLTGNMIHLISGDKQISKEISITESGIRIDITSHDDYSTVIPYLDSSISSKIPIDSFDRPYLEFEDWKTPVISRSSGSMTRYSFWDVRDLLMDSENPNREFPPGYFLPIPFTVYELSGSPNLSFELKFDE